MKCHTAQINAPCENPVYTVAATDDGDINSNYGNIIMMMLITVSDGNKAVCVLT